MQFEIFIEKKGKQQDPLETMMQDVVKALGKKNASLKVYDVSGKDSEEAKQNRID